MIKKTFIGIITLILVSCGSDHTDFSGNWIDKEKESDKMIISKNGDNYIVENRNKKFPAQIKDGLLEISTEMPIKATIDENDILIINGKEYLRYEKATKPKFQGVWKNEKTNEFEYEIEFSQNGSLTVTLLNNEAGEEEGHWWEKKKLKNLIYNNGVLTFKVNQNIDNNYRKWNMEMILENEKLKVTEKEINSPYGDREPYTKTYSKE